ncbi:hypothetical protein [Polaromonas sp.]|uniref:hypothetical protein n=1 Tax=Polaromonas sp. TaxID=1869339 RepID=UPI00178EB7F2|nr:hypothetical protein [Polaromonas sp.]NMM07853.1 hypothetical protein [Polaromonas sp.]
MFCAVSLRRGIVDGGGMDCLQAAPALELVFMFSVGCDERMLMAWQLKRRGSLVSDEAN